MTDNKKQLQEMAEMLKALAHPVRLCIARRLWQKGACNVTEMQECLEMPQSTASQHLCKMRLAGIIEGDRHGLEVFYSLKDKRVEHILSVLFEQEACKAEEAEGNGAETET